MTSMARSLGGAGDIQAVRPGGTTQTVTVAGSSAATTNAVGARTTVVRVISTTDCHLAFGSSPTATTGGPFLVANMVEYFRVVPGTDKVAAIQSSAGGTLYVTECD